MFWQYYIFPLLQLDNNVGDRANKMSTVLRYTVFGGLVLLAIIAGWQTNVALNRVNASDFETLDGVKYQWKSFEGQWVVINYFAPWCAPCLREMPELAKFSQNLPENTHIFAVNYDRQTKTALKEMVTRFDIKVPVVFANEGTRMPMEKPQYLPATFIVGPEGTVVDTIMGEITQEALTRRLVSLKTL